MDKIKSAAIILIGLGDKCASEVLKNMSPKEVRAILEAINSIENVSEEDVMEAMNSFFKETSSGLGVDFISKQNIKNSIISAVGNKGLVSLINGIDDGNDQWIELIRNQSPNSIADLIEDEHPQLLTALMVIMFNYAGSEYGTALVKLLPKPLQSQIFKRMTNIGSMSKYGIEVLSEFFVKELENVENNNMISLDGVEAVANIISYLDPETENEIMNELSIDNKVLSEKIQDKVFPFHKLADLDNKSLQVLLKEVKNDDLVLALKGVDDFVKNVFMQNMSQKSAEILRDEMESKGPVKLTNVLEAQKRIIKCAKKLDEEEKIILSTKNNPDIVY